MDGNRQLVSPAVLSEPFIAAMQLYGALVTVPWLRALRGPQQPGWGLAFEIANTFAKARMNHIFECSGEDGERIAEARLRDRMVVPVSPALLQMDVIEATDSPVPGRWFEPENAVADMLYLRGGAYSYRPLLHDQFIAFLANNTHCRVFVPDYRLIPEHPWPAQLEDALAAYRWLLDSGVDPQRLVVAGESAGGHLTLTLLMALRDAKIALPRCAVCTSPLTDPGDASDSLERNSPIDFLEARMLRRWMRWLTRNGGGKHPLFSPMRADPRGLPPIYIQVGSAEILYGMVCRYVDYARAKGADIEFDTWPHMTHTFMTYGPLLPESEDALSRIGKFVEKQLLREAAAAEPRAPMEQKYRSA